MSGGSPAASNFVNAVARQERGYPPASPGLGNLGQSRGIPPASPGLGNLAQSVPVPGTETHRQRLQNLAPQTISPFPVHDAPPVSDYLRQRQQLQQMQYQAQPEGVELSGVAAPLETLSQPFESGRPVTFTLGENVYTAAVIVPLALDKDHKPVRRGAVFFAVFLAFTFLFLNLFVQGALMYYMGRVNEATPRGEDRVCLGWDNRGNRALYGFPEQESEQRLLAIVGLIVFLCANATDILETVDAIQWLYWVPTTPRQREITIATDTEGNARWASGLTYCYKWACVFFVYIPKLVIAGFLIALGSEYILKSKDSEEMLLVMVAMTFIISVDEVFYACFTPTEVKAVISELPPVYVPCSQRRMVITYVIRPLVTFVVIVLLVILMMGAVCDVLD